MKPARWAILAAVLLCGCSAEWYRRSADSQVQRLLKDRGETTLGYTPSTEIKTTVDPVATKKAYETIPATPIPPPLPPPLEPAVSELPPTPLGPEDLFGEDASPRHELLSEQAAREPAVDRLRLGPPTTVPPGPILDLFSAIEFGAENSREYENRLEDLFLATLDVTLERHLFSPRAFANSEVQYTGSQEDSNYRSALSVTNSVGVRQQLPYGGEIVAQALVDFVDQIRGDVAEGESAQLVLSGTIPLLRGAGRINLDPLVSAERELVYEVRRFEDFRRDYAVRVATQYFRLLSQQQAIANRRYNYVVLLNLTEQTEALYGAGRINFLQVQRALQSLLQAENSLIDAEDVYGNSLDNFKLLIGMPVDEPLEVVAVELNAEVPDVEAEATELAQTYRLDLQTARDRIEDARRGVEVAQNGLLPDLDFSARGSIGNRDDTPARQIDDRTAEYSASLRLDLPLDRLRERNDYRRALIFLERAQRSFALARDTIVANVRDSVRNFRSARATLEIQRRGIELAQRRLDFSTELLIQGRATDSRDVVEAQNALLEAQDRFERARADLQIALLNFLRDTGLLRVDPTAGSLGIAMARGTDTTETTR